MNIVYQLVALEQYEEVLDLFNNYFLPYNPIQKALNCTFQTDKLDQDLLNCLKKGFSWCAIDEETGKMVGVRLASSETYDEIPNILPTFDDFIASGWSENWSAIWILMQSALDTKKMLSSYGENKILELYALCVHPDYTQRGIATELVKRTLAHGVKEGFTFAGVVCTNAYAQQLFEKLEFTKVDELLYSTYVDPGSNSVIFKDVEEPHKSAASYVKKLV